jgi:hypothetical protein
MIMTIQQVVVPAGMVFTRQPDHTMMLLSGPGTTKMMRGVLEKYFKFE